nr:flagellar biosynthesis anti-sigma factor FlgM [Citrobacter freundii]EKU3954144.1 flagellar biosynthesis anti-sigma factor FlgM [Citrobacter freundii]
MHPDWPTEQARADKSSVQTSTSSSASLSADDITQAGLQTAQQTLNSDTQSDVDYDKVAQMQAMLASGDLQVDTDQLAGDMLSFFQK